MKKLLLTLPILLSISFNAPLLAQLSAEQLAIDEDQTMQYLFYTPSETSEKMPLVVFLHGGGEGGTDIEKVKIHGIPKLIAGGKDFPFYMIAPQNPYARGFWNDRAVDKIVDHIISEFPIDTSRVYLAGLSRGGYGVWRMAINNPGKYAAMISVCAASIPQIYVNRIGEMPVWLFHGEEDSVVPVEVSINAYEKMKPANPNVKLTLYPDTDHDSWTPTFLNEEVYEWLLKQRKN
ncbi:MAG: dienelactone hydrolase family protein [Balneolaceae bacterium]|nr:dienelactone hydrolase family protein [Balneolaceae bacterium]MBO6546704.1 dienelactone hydrolase family protein [Balneolaceae bacterium]MBO6649062.1 dienelactone hydrolase family protein [Balneolaceae bacterium]